METFIIYLKLGFQHITDLQGYDHILFIMALCASFTLEDWKKVLILISCFTLGHTFSLAASVLRIINLPSSIIEFLIPLTIIITCLHNVINIKEKNNIYKKSILWEIGSVLFFGLIHGLGFSNYLKSLIGKNSSIITELLSFNIGLEIGQILIISFIFFILTLLRLNLNIKKTYLNIGLSMLVLGLTLPILISKWIF